MNLFEHIKSLLSQNEKYCKDGKLFKNVIVEDALKVEQELLSILLSDDKAIQHFFTEVGKVLVFDKIKFQKFVSNKQFLPDSYTAYKNKIGLTANGEYLTEAKEVVLSWAYKDCVLEGGQTKEEQKRKEIFWNETLAPDEIDRLLEPKALNNFKRFDGNGEIPIKNISLEDNYIIKGNNLLALHSLKKVYQGKIKLIYIDPPYNTGGDGFNYNDSFNHSAWLTFMKNRLEVAKELLNNDGIIYISCDDRENSYLKVLCDGVFGRDNFITNLIWRKKAGGGNDSQDIAVEHEYILAYRKKNNGIYKLPLDEKTMSSYKLSDTKVATYGKHKTKDLNDPSLSDSSGLHYDIVCPDNTILKGDKHQWKCNKETFDIRLKDDRIVFKKVKDQWRVNYKIYLNEEKGKLRYDSNGQVIQKGRNLSSILYNTALNKDGSNDIKKLFDGDKPFSYPKPVKLLETLILSATTKDDIILDFFAGSGTTAEAVIKVNSLTNSKRKFILVEQMDYIETVTSKRAINSFKSYGVSDNFVFFSLADLNNDLCLSIINANNKQSIFNIYDGFSKIKNINYNLKTLPTKEDLKNLELVDLKKVLIDFLDLNNQYISFYDINDEDYNNSTNKEYSTKFYNL
jgi:adenine-specific DNA-methyltransferase